TWLARIFDMAWAAQTDSSFSDAERSQALAFAYGFATHAAGDLFAHTLVNEFSEGVYPAYLDILSGLVHGETEGFANALRHIMVEGYIGDATPGKDHNGDRSLLPDGDLSDAATPAIFSDVPSRFIYDALIAPFPGDPTAPADTGVDQHIDVV